MKDRVIAINESVYTLTTQKNTNCKSCIYNSKHNGYFNGGCICEKYGTYISEPENCICVSFINEPMTLENAIDYLQAIGWMQEHDKALTEDAVPVVRCKDCRWWNDGTQMCSITISATPYGHCHDGETWEEGERKDDED